MKLRLLPCVTSMLPTVATPSEGAFTATSHEYDWVRWLLSSVRARTETLLVGDDDWPSFARHLLPQTIGPVLRRAWLAAHDGDLSRLIALDEHVSARLSPTQSARSLRAGSVLLKSTRHARYQGVLGRLREATGQNLCRGHIVIVWPTVAHFFQLGLTSAVAEYLRLEWDIHSRERRLWTLPAPPHSLTALTRRVMRAAD